MANLPWELILAVTGALVPIIAFLWEFALVGRKRLGYRVQMDTAPTAVDTLHAGAWRRLERADGGPLTDPSFALIRIENIGTTNIAETDYAFPENTPVGIRVRFPGRRIAGVVVTELSDPTLATYFGEKAPGLSMSDLDEAGQTVGLVELPKVKLNSSDHYKVLVVLERAEGFVLEPAKSTESGFPDPEVVGTISGGVASGKVHKTKGQTGTPRWVVALVCFLLMVSLAEPFIFELTSGRSAPLDCATGNLTVTGSTAFEPVLREAADTYARSCPDSGFAFDMHGSAQGLELLNRTRSPEMVAFSDGVKGDRLPELLPRPTAFLLFTIVINRDAGVQDLTLAQVRDVFSGRIANWREVGGNDVPVRIVDREALSGTRATLEQRILSGAVEPGENSNDCVEPINDSLRGVVVRCRRADTGSMLDAVVGTSGAIGYSELRAATDRTDLLRVRIDGQDATLEAADHGAYPFWQTEYAYTFGEPAASSLAASFMRYLTNQVGSDIIRSYGNRPCAELANPVLCRPTDG
ncbi:substrate-binding domain-containing protein [Saccharopolyspora sp. 5N708]|uniref:substrate-binding domain-containing protein n=1 Tax=Saccharopolyspora sp. 5N708 TaxID=3457424 RepID=UPI003FD40808